MVFLLPIQVRYSSNGGMYVTASKDGSIRIWDGANANCVRSIVGAHGSAEATSAIFTKDLRYDTLHKILYLLSGYGFCMNYCWLNETTKNRNFGSNYCYFRVLWITFGSVRNL